MFSVIFVLGLLYHTYTDLKFMLLYDKVTLFLAAVGLVRAWYEGQLFDAAYGAEIMLAIMLVLYFASRGGMGEGCQVSTGVGYLAWLRAGTIVFAARLCQRWCCSGIIVAVQAWEAETGYPLRTVFVRSSGCCVFWW